MITKNLAYLCLFLASLLIVNCDNINLNNTAIHADMDGVDTKYQYYEILLNQDLLEQSYYYVVVTPDDITSNPDVYYSFQIFHPNTTSYDGKCDRFGGDICIFENKKKTKDTHVYVAVHCVKECHYEIKSSFVENTQTNLLKNNDETIFWFYENNTIRADLSVPYGKNFTKINIYAYIENWYTMDSSLHMYVKKKVTDEENNPIEITPSNADLTGTTSWLFGEIVSISQEDTPTIFCSHEICAYQILLVGPADAIVWLSTSLLNSTTNIELDESYYDSVNKNGINFYKLQLEDSEQEKIKDKNLIFKLASYAGNPQIYIKLDEEFDDALRTAKYRGGNLHNERIIITPKQRKIDSIYYIAISASVTSAYSFYVTTSDITETNLYLTVPDSGFVNYHEIINYHLKLNYIPDDNTLFITLSEKSGQSDMYVLVCNRDLLELNDDEGCLITKEIIQDPSDLEEKGLLFYANNFDVQSNDLEITLDKEFCPDDTCELVIGIVGQDPGKAESSFTIVAHTAKSHVILLENEILRNILHKGEVNYYKFTVLSDDTIEGLDFYCQYIVGSVKIYISKTNEYPDENDHENMLTGTGGSSLTITNNFYGSYYVGIVGLTQSIIDILFKINRRVKSAKEYYDYAIELFEGDSFTDHIKYGKNDCWFKFYYDTYSPEWVSEAIVTLTPIRGSFRIEILDDLENLIASTESEPYILITEYIDTSKYLYIHVLPNNIDVYSLDKEIDYEFEIMFDLGSYPYYLQDGYDTYEYILGNNYNYFQFYYKAEDKNVIFTINSDEEGLTIYLSYNESNPYPSYKNFNLKSNNNSLIINNTDATWQCKYQENNYDNLCVFYVSVFNKNNNSLYYSITGTRHYDFITLIQGREEHIDLHALNEVEKLEYVFQGKIEVRLSSPRLILYTYSTRFKVLTTIWKEGNDSNKLNGPSADDDSYSQILLFDENYTEFCAPACVIMANVTFIRQNENENDENYWFDYYYYYYWDQISVLMTTIENKISEGERIQDHVFENFYNYYIVAVGKDVPLITITVSPIDSGYIDILANKGNDPPTYGNAQYISYIYYGGYIQINQTELDQSASDPYWNFWTIGVYGYSECTYTISVYFQIDEIHEIYLGEIYELPIYENKPVYFELKFWPYLEEITQIRYSVEYGNASIYANEYLSNSIGSSIHDYIPQPGWSNITWKNTAVGPQGGEIQILHSLEEFHIYLLTVCSDKNTTLTLFSRGRTTPVSIHLNSPLIDYTNENSTQNSYYYGSYTYVDYLYQLSVNVFSGQLAVKICLYYYSDCPYYEFNEESSDEKSEIIAYLTDGDVLLNKEDIFGNGNERLLTKKKANKYKDSRFSSDKLRTLQYTGYEHELNYFSYSIVVECYDICIYELIIEDLKFGQIKLIPGLILHDTLSIDQKKNYTISFIKKNETDFLKFNLFLTNNPSRAKDYFVYVYIYYPNNNTLSEQTHLVQEIFDGDFWAPQGYSLLLKNISSNIYMFTVVAKEDIEYDILATSQNYELIAINSQDQDYITLDTQKIYQLYTPYAGTLIFQLYQCFGEVNIAISNDYYNFKNDVYEAETTGYGQELIQTKINVDVNLPIFVKLTPKIQNNMTSFYNISHYSLKIYLVSNNEDNPFDFLHPGNNKIVHATTKGPNMHISFKPLEIWSSTTKKYEIYNKPHGYLVIVARNQIGKSYLANCQNRAALSNNIFFDFKLNQYTKIYFEVNESSISNCCDVYADLSNYISEEYFIDVQAYVLRDEFNNRLPMTIPYTQTTTTVKFHGAMPMFVLVGLIMLVIILLIIIYCMRRKIKFLNKIFQYEMSDITNMARANDSSAIKPKYSTFKEETDNQIQTSTSG